MPKCQRNGEFLKVYNFFITDMVDRRNNSKLLDGDVVLWNLISLEGNIVCERRQSYSPCNVETIDAVHVYSTGF